jgi:outer membrane immunogenic protein
VHCADFRSSGYSDTEPPTKFGITIDLLLQVQKCDSDRDRLMIVRQCDFEYSGVGAPVLGPHQSTEGTAMKKLLLGTAMSLAMVAGATAADLGPASGPAPFYTKAPPAWSWTGFYIGVNAGDAWSSAAFGITPTGAWAGFPANAANIVQATTDTLHPSGFAGGGQLGWNYQMNNIVIGLEADIDYVHASAALVGGPIALTSITGFSQGASEQWLGTMRGRLGFLLMPQALVYGTGGLAVAGWNLNMHMTSAGVDAVFADSETRTGWTAGGGLEVAFGNSWSGKVEYLHADFGTVTGTSVFPPPNGANFTHTHTVGLKTDTARAGLNYHFNWGPKY